MQIADWFHDGRSWFWRERLQSVIQAIQAPPSHWSPPLSFFAFNPVAYKYKIIIYDTSGSCWSSPLWMWSLKTHIHTQRVWSYSYSYSEGVTILILLLIGCDHTHTLTQRVWSYSYSYTHTQHWVLSPATWGRLQLQTSERGDGAKPLLASYLSFVLQFIN